MLLKESRSSLLQLVKKISSEKSILERRKEFGLNEIDKFKMRGRQNFDHLT